MSYLSHESKKIPEPTTLKSEASSARETQTRYQPEFGNTEWKITYRNAWPWLMPGFTNTWRIVNLQVTSMKHFLNHINRIVLALFPNPLKLAINTWRRTNVTGRRFGVISLLVSATEDDHNWTGVNGHYNILVSERPTNFILLYLTPPNRA